MNNQKAQEKARYYTKNSFSISDFLAFVKGCKDSAIILNSCFSVALSIEYLDENKLNEFEPVCSFHNEDSDILMVYDYSGSRIESLTLGEFKRFVSDESIDTSIPLNRDIEDGYVYSDYDNIICNSDCIVLC